MYLYNSLLFHSCLYCSTRISTVPHVSPLFHTIPLPLLLANMSGVNCERPIARYQPPDWHERNAKMSESVRAKREQSINLRKEAQQLRIETETKTKWHNFDNNMRLSERAMEIERWQKELERYLNEVISEAVVLEDAKEACERALEAKVQFKK